MGYWCLSDPCFCFVFCSVCCSVVLVQIGSDQVKSDQICVICSAVLCCAVPLDATTSVCLSTHLRCASASASASAASPLLPHLPTDHREAMPSASKRYARARGDELSDLIAECDDELFKLNGITDGIRRKRMRLMTELNQMMGRTNDGETNAPSTPSATSGSSSSSSPSGYQAMLAAKRARVAATRDFATQTE